MLYLYFCTGVPSCTHRGRNEEGLKLVSKGVGEAPWPKTESREKQGRVRYEQANVENTEDDSNNIQPLRPEGN